MSAANAVATTGIAAIVVAYDSEETLDDCLSRLRAAQGVGEIRVVDNDSRDGTLDIRSPIRVSASSPIRTTPVSPWPATRARRTRARRGWRS